MAKTEVRDAAGAEEGGEGRLEGPRAGKSRQHHLQEGVWAP